MPASSWSAVLSDRAAFAAAAASRGIRIAADDTWSDMFSRVLVEKVEPKLGIGRATLLTEYPLSEAALARAKPEDPRFAERFELYACGVELANGFAELTDAAEQRRRFAADMDEKERIHGERYPLDEDFLAALDHMPEASGVALGLDRLVMLATGASSIDQVQWTPVAGRGGRADERHEADRPWHGATRRRARCAPPPTRRRRPRPRRRSATALEAVAARYAVAITPAMADLIDRQDPADPIARQFVPDIAELTTTPEERADPIGDRVHEVSEGLIHRYPDRVLFKLVSVCPVYCRFCFRRETVGQAGSGMLSPARHRCGARLYPRP